MDQTVRLDTAFTLKTEALRSIYLVSLESIVETVII